MLIKTTLLIGLLFGAAVATQQPTKQLNSPTPAAHPTSQHPPECEPGVLC